MAAFVDFFLIKAQPTRFRARDYRKKSQFWNDCQTFLSLAYPQLEAMSSAPGIK